MTDERKSADKPSDSHTVVRYDEELQSLEKLVAEMGRIAITQVQGAIQALMEGDTAAARHIIYQDKRLNYLDMDGKEKAVALFAIRTPVARDLRLVMSLHQITGILEHIGDEAKSIASIVVRIVDEDRSPPTPDLMREATDFGDVAVGMLQHSMNALASRSVDDAVQVLQREQDLNAEFRSALRRLSTFLMKDPRNLRHSIDMVCVYRSLENIGDYARNLSEQLIYIVKAKDVRYMNVENLVGGYLEG